MNRLRKVVLCALLAVLTVVAGVSAAKYARYVFADSAPTVSVTEIDYDNMTLTMKGNGDSTFYFSDSRQKTWETVVGKENNGSVTMDISWISATKDYVLSLKGDKSTTPTTVTLPKYNTGFKVSYNRVKGTATYTGIPDGFSGDIQWRVKGKTEWNNTTKDANLADKFAPYINGVASTVIYFRTSAIKGASAAEAGSRPSKEAYITIAKNAAAPSVTVDGGKFQTKVAAGVQYRLVGTSTWSNVYSTAKTLNVKEFAQKAFYSSSNTEPVDQIIEFRSEATSTAQISNSTFIKISAQKSAEDVELTSDNVKFTFLSGSTVKVYFDVSEDNSSSTYEYAITDSMTEPESDVSWTAFTTKSTTDDNGNTTYYVTKNISKSVFAEGQTIWIRRKSSGTSGTSSFQLASAPYSYKLSAYPGNSSDEADTVTELSGIRNTEYSSVINFTYKVDASIDENNTGLASIGLYKDNADDTVATTTMGTSYYEVPDTYVTVGDHRYYTVSISAEGMTSLLADKALATDTPYYFGIVLDSGEKVIMKTTVKVLTETKFADTYSFTKIAGYDRNFTLTLNYGTKLASNYTVKLICNGNTVTDDNIEFTYVDASGDEVSADSATYVKADFTLEDEWLTSGKSVKLLANIYNSGGAIVETVSGATVALEQPITASQSGSRTFTAGNCTIDLTFTLTLNSDEDVTDDFSITDIMWGDTSLAEGVLVDQSGTNASVTISKDVLNKLSAGTNYLTVVINGAVECQIKYKITVNQKVQTSKFSSMANMSLLSLKGDGENENETTIEKDVEVVAVDYENGKLKIDSKESAAVLYSVNKKTWFSAGETKDSNGYIVLDISWVTDTKNYTVYFKGIENTSEDAYEKVVFPKKNTTVKVVFDKTSNADSPKLTVTKTDEDVTAIQWRKSTSYNWNTINVDSSGSYIIKDLEYLRTKGGKIVVRTAAVAGSDADNMGIRYSKEVTIAIAARGAAPSVKINPFKLTVNTTAAIEYYDTKTTSWVKCTKGMSIWDIPEVKASVKGSSSSDGASDVVVKFRRAATKTAGYTKYSTVRFDAQAKAPTLSTSETADVTYSTLVKTVNKKDITYRYLTFNKASRTDKYQYVIVSEGATFNESTASWTTVTSNKKITLSSKKAVSGATIYVRKAGVNANATMKTNAVLASAAQSFTID